MTPQSRQIQFEIANDFENAPLKGGAGGGTYDGMEARVAALEAHMQHVRDDITGIRATAKQAADDIVTIKVDIATMKTTVANLPTKGWGVTALSLSLGVIIALVTLAPKIQSWLWGVPLPKP